MGEAEPVQLAAASEFRSNIGVHETSAPAAAAEPAEVDPADRYPSATTCGECHPKQYREWSISQHAYAQMSPVFNAMQGTLIQLTNGTQGDFCIRCHTPVGMNLREKEFMSNIDRYPTSREGVTCVVCHRITQTYGKISGRLALEEGPLTAPIYGPTGDNAELMRAIKEGGLITDPTQAGRHVHGEIRKLDAMSTSGYCASCHDVVLLNGFRLEDAFSEWKNSPAASQNVSCQDCHMGKEPGRILADRDDPEFERKNYDFGPAAVVGTLETKPRKLTSHLFVGPDYSVLPPSLFPLNSLAIKEEHEKDDPTARGLATIREWLQFDHAAGWGTDDFEDTEPDEDMFPERWASVDDRYDARAIIDENLELLDMIEGERLKLFRTAYLIEDMIVDRADERGLAFRIKVASGTNGHSVPTGFDAERLVWLHVWVEDAGGTKVYESGDLDPNGDVRDTHSTYVHNGELPLDTDLFSLQSRFLTTSIRGPEQERVLAVPVTLSALRFLQPERQSSALVGRPRTARKHRQGLPPGAHRWAKYKVSGSALTGNGPYTAHIELKAAMAPVNLLSHIRHVGFDYGISARTASGALVAGHQVVWQKELTFDVHGSAMRSETAQVATGE